MFELDQSGTTSTGAARIKVVGVGGGAAGW